MADPPSFEETYPRYEFSELVRLAIAVGVRVGDLRRTRRRERRPEVAASSDDVPSAPA